MNTDPSATFFGTLITAPLVLLFVLAVAMVAVVLSPVIIVLALSGAFREDG